MIGRIGKSQVKSMCESTDEKVHKDSDRVIYF